MKVKYNRVSTLQQTGNRFSVDTEKYDLVFFDKVSGTIDFKDRPKGKELCKLIEEGKVSELYLEDLSRIGRNTGSVISNLQWIDGKGVNVVVRNIGLQSRPNGVKNPIWTMITSVMSSMYEMELENIKERTMTGRLVYVQKGGKLGRPEGTNETDKDFLTKELTQKIIKNLNKGLTIRDISKIVGCSNKTIIKTKKLMSKSSV